MSNESKHVAIECKHTTAALRAEIIPAISQAFAEGRVDVNRLTDLIVGVCSKVMWEHAEEIVAEYRKIIAPFTRNPPLY